VLSLWRNSQQQVIVDSCAMGEEHDTSADEAGKSILRSPLPWVMTGRCKRFHNPLQCTSFSEMSYAKKLLALQDEQLVRRVSTT